MRHPEAERWNNRYEEEGTAWLVRSPNPLLTEHAHLLPERGLGLDFAAGVATNGLFLAQRGLRVIALDISETGLRLALGRAKEENASLEVAAIDLTIPQLPPSFFDVILNFRFFSRESLPVLRSTLKPGGLLFFEAFVGIVPDVHYPRHYLEAGELVESFVDWETIYWSLAPSSKPRENLPRMRERLVARRPLS